MDEGGLKIDDALIHKKTLYREVDEETGCDLDTLPPDDVFELPSFPGIKDGHKNFVVYLRKPLYHAAPDDDHRWEMVHNGVLNLDIGEDVPGGYHSWVPLQKLQHHPNLMPDSKDVIGHLLRMLSDDLVPAQVCYQPLTHDNASIGASSSSRMPRESGSLRKQVKYAKDFQQQLLREPEASKPLDEIRKFIGRLSKVKDVQLELIVQIIVPLKQYSLCIFCYYRFGDLYVDFYIALVTKQ